MRHYIHALKIADGEGGFTLTEMFVTASLMGFIFLTIISVYVVGRQYNAIVGTYADNQSHARIVIDWIARDVKAAGEASTTLNIAGINFTSGANVIALKVPSVDINDDVIDVNKDGTPDYYDYIGYRRIVVGATSEVQRAQAADVHSSRETETRTLSKGVSALSFTYLDVNNAVVTPVNARKVTVSVTSRETLYLGKITTETLSSEIKLRNKK